VAFSALPVLTDQCPLRSGSRNHYQMTRQSEFRNSL
jgi:hypothetical protein